MADQAEQLTTTRVLALTQFGGVTPRLFEALLRRFKTLDAIYAAEPPDFLQIEGISEEQAENLGRASQDLEPAGNIAQLLAERDIGIVTRFDRDYCRLLFELNDPPSLLFYRGQAFNNERQSVAVVGCRTASAEGIELTSRLVKQLAGNQIHIVSSLVGGIDIAAHLAARGVEGTSFGLLDCGHDHIDPAEGIPVAIDIVQSGGVFSEYAPEVPPGEGQDCEANRLVVGMAAAVVVTEAYADSDRTLDLLRACRDIGKLAFFMIDPDHGALADKTSLEDAAKCGAIPVEGLDRVDDIIKSLV